MTNETENNRVFDTRKILTIAMLAMVLNESVLIGIGGLSVMFDLAGPITKCSGLSVDGIPWGIIITMVYQLAVILMGISADIALNMYLIKKRNRGGVRLAPWNVSSNQDNNYNCLLYTSDAADE